MLKVLVKKQLMEVFKGYFYNAKKNRMRSKWAIAAWFVFFAVIMVGVLGGMFTALSLTLCDPLTKLGLGWMYFLMMGTISILLGAFGSVFNTYAGLYLSKDNDLLLSLPIPVRTIIAARLINVYLMGAMYALTALLPALIVYWVVAGATLARLVCGACLFLIVTFIVLTVSCLLGWVVAKLSLKLKNKSFISMLVTLLLMGAYYFFYFKANDLIQSILKNAQLFGARIRGTLYGLYLFGGVGTGDLKAAAICLAVTAALFALVWIALTRSFLNLATASEPTARVRYRETEVRRRSAFAALLGKELGRFTASTNYMLNCGLGALFLPAGGVLLLVKGRQINTLAADVLTGRPGCVPVLLAAAICLVSSMIGTAAPSVSLEGRSLWIPQSLPVAGKTVLRAKASLQLLLTVPPMLFASVCAAVIPDAPASVRLLVVALPLAFAAFLAVFDTVVGVSMPVLSWTNELAPIKQSGAVAIALFGSWAVCVAFGGLYMLVGYKLGAAAYLAIWAALYAAAAGVLLRWLDTKGAAIFAAL